MAQIIYKDSQKPNRTVKNLGWLLRRRRSDVDFVEVHPESHFKQQKKGAEVRLTATMKNGDKFVTSFASKRVCVDFVMKRKWKSYIFS
jgi:hypothetical protein